MAEAERAGWSRSRLRWAVGQGELIRLRQGVYTCSSTWAKADLRRKSQLLIMAHQQVTGRLVATGLSAAAALGLPLPPGYADDGVALLRRPSLRPIQPGERVIDLPGGPVVARIETIVVDCARVIGREWGLAIADAAIAQGWTTPARLRSTPVARGSRQAAAARWVLEHAQDKVESPLESLARAVIILSGLGEPMPQQWVTTRAGRFRVDLLDEKTRVITEADGKIKYADGAGETLWNEKGREDALRDEGFEVVRFVMADLYHQSGFRARYAQACSRATTRTG